MNPEKLKKLQSQVRIGGKGTPRRKKKVVHQTPGTDDKKLQSVLKKIGVNPIPGIEEVNMIKSDGSVIHFNNPKAQASLGANTFAITGHGDHKQISDMIPNILSLGNYGDILKYSRFADVSARAAAVAGIKAVDDEVPTLVEDFEDTANKDIDENAKSNVIEEIAAAV